MGSINYRLLIDIRDITERKKMEKDFDLSKQVEKLESFYEEAIIGYERS